MPGFLTHYLMGMETCDSLSDNYIQNVIRNNNHAFLIGLQGSDLLSFNPHSLSKRGLSYRTAAISTHSQEYAAFFNHMLDYTGSLKGQERDCCIAYMAGYMCYYAIDQFTAPYICYLVGQNLPAKSRNTRIQSARKEIETTIDTILLRSHSHMEPSQLNFEALTYANKKDLASIGRFMRYTVQTTYKYTISTAEIANGLRAVKRQCISLKPANKFKRVLFKSIEKATPALPVYQKTVYEDFRSDDADYMNVECKPWYAYPGCMETNTRSFEELFQYSVASGRMLLECLDRCLSWGMDRSELITTILNLSPYTEY